MRRMLRWLKDPWSLTLLVVAIDGILGIVLIALGQMISGLLVAGLGINAAILIQLIVMGDDG